MIFRTTRSGQIIEQFEHESKVTRSDEDEKMEVMRPFDSFFDKKKCINISIGTIIEYQGKIFEDYCNKFVITEIKDEVPYIIIRIRKINHDGTLGKDCWANYDSNMNEVLSEDQFVTVNENLIKIRLSLYFYFDSSLHLYWSVVYRFLYF